MNPNWIRYSAPQCFKCYTIIKTLVCFLSHSFPLPLPPPHPLHCYIHVLHTLFVWCCWWSSGHSRPRDARRDTDESVPSLSPDLWLAAREGGAWMSGMNECIRLRYSSVPRVHQVPIDMDISLLNFFCLCAKYVYFKYTQNSCMLMLNNVIHSTGCVLVNTRPHQLCWGDRDMYLMQEWHSILRVHEAAVLLVVKNHCSCEQS